MFKGEGVAYRGRVLFEIQTHMSEIQNNETVADIKHIESLKVGSLLNKKKFKLHAAFFNANLISEIENPIEFEVSVGNYGNKLDENLLPSCSTTSLASPIFDGCSYYFLPWNDVKPCVQIISYWEDIIFRIESLNQIKHLKSFVVITQIKY